MTSRAVTRDAACGMSGKLNCRPGDLAVVVHAPIDGGRLVIVEARAWHDAKRGQFWWVEAMGSPFMMSFGTPQKNVAWPDAWLRPIRDQSGDDETLVWAGLPRKSRGDGVRAAKIDANHTAVVDALRKAGATVQSLAGVGPDQLKWHAAWQGGTLAVVDSPEAALRALAVLA